MAEGRLKVLIDSPRIFVRPQNTDWRYMRSLSRLAELEPIEILFPSSIADAIAESAHYVRNRFGSMLPLRSPLNTRSGALVAADSRRADVVFSHRRIPLGLDRPVIWFFGVADPIMQSAEGRAEEDIRAQYDRFAEGARAATLVQLPAAAECRRHAAVLPGVADRLVDCPFLIGVRDPIGAAAFASKHDVADPLDILFIGREGIRKGADLLIEAVATLVRRERRAIRLTVVTATPLTVPSDVAHAITVRTPLASPEVARLMRRAHVFAMPSRFETYGFTLVEAMAQGCAVIGPAWETQRELLDDGIAGRNVAADTAAIGAAIEEMLDPAFRLQAASAALQRFHDRYAERLVARRQRAVLEQAAA